MKIEASAPSNIALIKYMGKTGIGNLPGNASLSYTLNHLRSFVTLEPSGDQDEWRPLEGLPALTLSPTGRQKFLAHFARLKTEWGIPGSYVLRSANNFPADCGLASSASSFAALTLATWELAKTQGRAVALQRADLSRLSRLGSGSSCRSFFAPWALWRIDGAEVVDLSLELEHAVVVVAPGQKAVSSSEAHQRVPSSPLFQGRSARAETRLGELMHALARVEWRQCFELCWSETWDMHALFETSRPSFGYMKADSLAVLRALQEVWRVEDDGPLVTMDAGANVHLLLRREQTARADDWLKGHSAIKSWGAQ